MQRFCLVRERDDARHSPAAGDVVCGDRAVPGAPGLVWRWPAAAAARLWVTLPLLCGGAAQAANLLDIYRQAQLSDPTYQGARHALQAAEERRPQARAALLPAISLVGNLGRQLGESSFGDASAVDRQVSSRSWNLQLTQPLWRPGSWAALDQAQWQETLAREQFRLAEQELILRTSQSYLDVLVAEEAGRVAGLQGEAVGQQLLLAQRNFEVGMGTVTDVHEAQARLDLSRAQAVAARSEVDNKRAELGRIVGTAPGPLAALREDGGLPELTPGQAAAWEDSARVQALPVRAAQAALEVASREIDKSEAAHSPTLDFTAGYGNNFSSGSVSSPADIATRYHARQVGLNLTVPLYAGGGVQARVREAVALRDKAADDLEAARRVATAQASQAFSGVVNGLAQVGALASAITSSKSAVDANKIGYRIGTRINIDVLNAEQQLYAARRDWHKARVDTLLQGLRLKAANATLGDDDLLTLNHLLEPDTSP